MTLPEDDITDFFAELRAEDKKTAAPSFPGLPRQMPKRKLRYLAAPLGIGIAAASLLLFIFFRSGTQSSAMPEQASVLVITLETEQPTNTELLLSAPDPVFSWESPSASLIADF